MTDTSPRLQGAARRRRRWLVGVVVLIALAAAGFAVVRPIRPANPEPPGVDPTRLDPAIFRTIDLSRAIVLRSPRSATAWGELGQKFLAHHFFDEAVTCLTRAEQLDPRAIRWPYCQALAVRRTDPDTAIAALQRAAGCDSNAPEVVRLMLADLLLQRGRLDEADAQFRHVLAQDPDNPRALLGLGQVAYERDALGEALSQGRRVADDPRVAKAANIFVATVYQRLGDRTAAGHALERSRNLPDDPRWPDPFADEVVALQVGLHADLARAAELLRQDHLSDALRLIQGTVTDYPDAALAWLLLGRILLRGRQLPAAEQAVRRALDREPDAPEAQFYLGVVLFLQQNPAGAEPHFRRALERKPDYTLAHYNLGHCRRQQGDRSGAAAAFRAALRCQPDLADAHLSLGEVLAEQGRCGEAATHLRQALTLRPNDSRAREVLQTVETPP
jgi:tetratricopeptide (TPR) repeat protein